MPEKIENIEKAIEILKPALNMIKYGKKYQFLEDEPLEYEERCNRVKEQLDKVAQLLTNI